MKILTLILLAAYSFASKDDIQSDSCPGCGDVEIPIALGKTLSEYSSMAEYVQDTIDINSIDPQDQVFLLANRSTEDLVRYERSVVERPKAAQCQPDVTIVSLRPENETDPTLIYFPACTRVRRCGGCCTHKLLSCQPTQVQTHAFEVIKSQYTGGAKTTYRGKEVQLIDEHLKCKCDCKIREEDCNPNLQKYDKSQCKCYCTNVDDQHKCLLDRDNKLWDSASCTCRCKIETSDCQSGFHFNSDICQCISSVDSPETKSETTTAFPTRSPEERRKYFVSPQYISHADISTYA